jgi:hypothetical protein
MLMSIEKDLLSEISVDDIIHFLVKNSTQFSRLLSLPHENKEITDRDSGRLG